MVHSSLRQDSMKALITFTDGGSRETVQRSVLKSIQTKFDYMVAVGVGAYVKDEEIRLLSTKGRSIHVKDFDGIASGTNCNQL